MKYKNRDGEIVEEEEKGKKITSFFYGTKLGRMLLKPLVSPIWQRFLGAMLDSRLSVGLVLPYKKMHHIDMSLYKPRFYESFNAFFTREIKEELRPIDQEMAGIVAPCDGKASVYPITEELSLHIKNTTYSIARLLKSKELAEKYKNGVALVVRLSGGDYHHYCYVADGKKGKNHYLHGVFHALTPLACEKKPVYQENAREFCRIRTHYFDEIIQMEVGAMLIGRINNLEEGIREVKKGEEKGYFSYGGSTIVVLFKEDAVDFDRDLLQNTEQGMETIVKMGERIGYRKMLDESKRFFSL
ncbi:MAG: phosphatidylserine decarboxylase [Lachnospiraceae bacterium]|nr:phosphatidylserine decarboxylase [Lachnospiraceae bacterium]